jgi:hypothetical protein
MAGRFPLLLDEHVPRALGQALRRLGWTVTRVVDIQELGVGADDEKIFAYAARHGCIVLSSDEAALWRPRQAREQGAPFPGMVCWPHRDRAVMTIGDAAEALEQMATEDDPFVYGYRFIQPAPTPPR